MSSAGNFVLTKTCDSNLLCTVESSNLEAVPAGTQITYTYNGDGSDGLAYPTIRVEGGTASGVCDWNQPPGSVLAKCSFGTGTGSLERFHLDIDVTVVWRPERCRVPLALGRDVLVRQRRLRTGREPRPDRYLVGKCPRLRTTGAHVPNPAASPEQAIHPIGDLAEAIKRERADREAAAPRLLTGGT